MKTLISPFYALIVAFMFLFGCQGKIPVDSVVTSPELRDASLQQLHGLFNEYLSPDNIPTNSQGRELDAALVIKPSSDDLEKYSDYSILDKTENGVEYMFLFGDYAVEKILDVTDTNLFGKVQVPNNPDCVGDSDKGHWANRHFYECVWEIVMTCDQGTTGFYVNGEYHVYSNCG